MEFVQFHPTGMVWPPSVRGILVTESVRGDGGVLKNSAGNTLHVRLHPGLLPQGDRGDRGGGRQAGTPTRRNNRRPPELLPRDEVARAINSEIKAGRGSPRTAASSSTSPPGGRRSTSVKRLPSMYHQFKELAEVDITAEADGDRPDLPLRDGRRRGRPRHGRLHSSPVCTRR